VEQERGGGRAVVGLPGAAGIDQHPHDPVHHCAPDYLLPGQGLQRARYREFNRQCAFEIERIRDFIILHYHATERDDTPFWNYVRTMEIPDTLREKMDLWRTRGRIVRIDNELFAEVGWLQVLEGQRAGSRPSSAGRPVAGTRNR
jgi:tryptophan halogenase